VPAFDSGRSRDFHRAPTAFCPAHPKIKLHTDPQIQSGEEGLYGETRWLRIVAIMPPDQFLSRGLLCLGPPLMLIRHGCISPIASI
jgi:hypothetical protein